MEQPATRSAFRLHRLLHCALTALLLLLATALLQPGAMASAGAAAADHPPGGATRRPAAAAANHPSGGSVGAARRPAAAAAADRPRGRPVGAARPAAAAAAVRRPAAAADHPSGRPVGAARPPAAAAAAIDLIVIGDSTAANYSNYPHTYPQSGWAMYLQDHLSPAAVTVRDAAVPGTSSLSYYRNQLWQQAKAAYLSAGDYVFIEFGHNDQRPDPLRHTDPFTTYEYYLSIYVNDTRAAMANPVLVTSISRGLWHSNGVFMSNTFGNYTIAMRQLAEKLRVPLIDLNEYTADLFISLGEETTQNTLFMCLPPGKYPNYPDGIHDTTHLQVLGAQRVAALAAEGIVKAGLPLQQYLVNAR